MQTLHFLENSSFNDGVHEYGGPDGTAQLGHQVEVCLSAHDNSGYEFIDETIFLIFPIPLI